MSAVVAVEFVILAADFNRALVDAMIAAAEEEAQTLGHRSIRVVRVPGCYEMPLIAELILAQPQVVAIAALGYIERGETLHGEVMGHVVHAALVQSQLKFRKPIGIGIIGPGATPEQAELRKIDYARSAVRAAEHCRAVAAKLAEV